MKNKYLIKIAITAIMIIGIPACGPCYDGPTVLNYNFKGFEDMEVLRIKDADLTEITDGKSVNVDSLLIKLTPITSKDWASTKKRNKSNSFFIQSSYACDFAVTENVDKSIIDFSISSSNDLNANYPAGSDLTDLFTAYLPSGASGSLKQNLIKNPLITLTKDKYFSLTQHPSIKGKHSFTFKITLNDTIITKTTEEILIE